MKKEDFLKEYNKLFSTVLINIDNSSFEDIKSNLDTLVLDFIENLEREIIIRDKELGILNDKLLTYDIENVEY